MTYKDAQHGTISHVKFNFLALFDKSVFLTGNLLIFELYNQRWNPNLCSKSWAGRQAGESRLLATAYPNPLSRHANIHSLVANNY